ncbi:MAG: DUF523 domain-containing protein [Bdellovibrionales bacterium]|jgi:uncharacterized protein YbbK (DUF523 family)
MYLVSACLTGVKCRYDGSDCANRIVQDMVNRGVAFPVCPEQLAGLPTPREACEISTDEKGNKKVVGKSGRDYTQEYREGAERTLALCKAKGVNEAILKSNSPSCGCGKIFDGTFSGKGVKGDGITTELLKKNGIQVKTEGDL